MTEPQLPKDKCPVCNNENETDMRRVLVECLYDVREVAPKMQWKVAFSFQERTTYGHFTECCQNCRADFLRLVQFWSEGGLGGVRKLPADVVGLVPVSPQVQKLLSVAKKLSQNNLENLSDFAATMLQRQD